MATVIRSNGVPDRIAIDKSGANLAGLQKLNVILKFKNAGRIIKISSPAMLVVGRLLDWAFAAINGESLRPNPTDKFKFGNTCSVNCPQIAAKRKNFPLFLT